MGWNNLTLTDKAELMKLYLQNGITSLDAMREHYNSLATGGSLPDYDPNNLYHYHDTEGNKVVISPEDWEANVGKPYFREVENAIKAEQAAYPEPEYEVNPSFVRDLRKTYQYGMGNGYQNYRNFSPALPQGYSFTNEGLIVDPQDNYYVQSGYRQSPRFTYNTDSPLQFTIHKGKPIERNLTFYPVNMDKRVKAPLPVDRVMNVDEEYKNAISKYLNDKSDLVRVPIVSGNYIGGNLGAFRNKKEAIRETIKDFNLKYTPIDGLDVDFDGNGNPVLIMPKAAFTKYKNEQLELDKQHYIDQMNRTDLNQSFRDDYEFRLNHAAEILDSYLKAYPYKPSRQKAEKHAVISIGPIEKVKTFQKGGFIGPVNPNLLILNPQISVADNTMYVGRPISDTEIDAREGLPEGTTTLRRAIAANASRPQAVISATVTPQETQKQINKAVKVQKALKPANKVLDAIENIPVLSDAVTVGRAASDAIHGDYLRASLLPFMWLGNKIPLGKEGIKQAAKKAVLGNGYTGTFKSNLLDLEKVYDKIISKPQRRWDLRELQDLRNKHFKLAVEKSGLTDMNGVYLHHQSYGQPFTIFNPEKGGTATIGGSQIGISPKPSFTTRIWSPEDIYYKYFLGKKSPVVVEDSLKNKFFKKGNHDIDLAYKNDYYLYLALKHPRTIDWEGRVWSNYPGILDDWFTTMGWKTNKIENIEENLFRKFRNREDAEHYIEDLIKELDVPIHDVKNFDYGNSILEEAWKGPTKTGFLNIDIRRQRRPETIMGYMDQMYSPKSDGFYVKNIKDGYDNHLFLQDEVNFYNPRNAKRFNAVTYDKNGNPIPLRLRDDFSNPDMNYAYGGKIYIKPENIGKITPYGQWKYPHQVTTIPSNNITMKGVNYPVLGVSDTGDTQMMYPNFDYLFNGNYVTEYPLHTYQDGGGWAMRGTDDTQVNSKDGRWYFPTDNPNLYNLRSYLTPDKPYGNSGYIVASREQLDKSLKLWKEQESDFLANPKKYGKVPSLVAAAMSGIANGMDENSDDFANYLTWTRWAWDANNTKSPELKYYEDEQFKKDVMAAYNMYLHGPGKGRIIGGDNAGDIVDTRAQYGQWLADNGFNPNVLPQDMQNIKDNARRINEIQNEIDNIDRKQMRPYLPPSAIDLMLDVSGVGLGIAANKTKGNASRGLRAANTAVSLADYTADAINAELDAGTIADIGTGVGTAAGYAATSDAAVNGLAKAASMAKNPTIRKALQNATIWNALAGRAAYRTIPIVGNSIAAAIDVAQMMREIEQHNKEVDEELNRKKKLKDEQKKIMGTD